MSTQSSDTSTLTDDRTPAPARSQQVRKTKSLGDRTFDLIAASWRPAAVVVGLFIVWWVITTLGWVPAYLIPAPVDVWHTMTSSAGFLWANALVTIYETVAGFIIAAVGGIAIAMWIVYSPNAEKSLYPLLVFAQVIPKVAIAPLFVIWLGFGSAPKVLVAVLVAFFPVVVSTIAGLRSVDPDLLDLASTMGSSQWKTFRKIRFPASLPHVFSGLKVAATLAVIGAVVGEFVGANEGIGYVLLNANGNLNTPMLYAGLVILSAIGIVVFMVIEVAERVFIPWQPSRRVTATAAS
ncbi:ABC transporter permease [Microbacterium sp. STN6]|uniref:ABC transporter permease n=1 Tax=Microbacterium sp. STN6 TaxID=2995588 RepID=UPI0022608CD5|nr:ABC transporter permease [Microbacterium sp. STN6]MCX7522813.1 ABC transporter permease [Microbacterium sp. STN6]